MLNRRNFLSTAALGALAAPMPALAAATGKHRPDSHAGLVPLAPGAVRPGGWIELYLRKQADRLGGKLAEISAPFSGEYWLRDQKPESRNGWWPWEQAAYWIDGMVRCALVLDDKALLEKVAAPLRAVLDSADPDGYLGPSYARRPRQDYPSDGNLRWPHTVFFRALIAYAEATGDPAIPEAVRRHFLADRERVPYGAGSRDVTNIEGMLWAFGKTDDPALLAMARQAWDSFQRSVPPGEYESGDLHPIRVHARAPINAHGVTYSEKAKLPAILYLHTGQSEYLRFAIAAQERVFAHHMLVDGIPSASEDYRGTSPLDAHETCDITDHAWSWSYLLQATGDAVWADRMERAVLNAGFGAIRKDWKAVQYFSCPNQVIATLDSSHVPYIAESHSWMAFRPNPGEEVACCAGNVHRFFPNHVIGMWMAAADGGLAAVQYGPSTVSARVGKDARAIEVVQETDYPFGETIDFVIKAQAPVRFALDLRIPAWCEEASLTLNGRPLAMPAVRRGFVRIDRRFVPGDRLRLALPMKAAVSHWSDGGIGFEHGPLVYALPVDEAWTSRVARPWSSTDYPDWEARPDSAWNLGVLADRQGNLPAPQIVRRAMTADPWVDPPVALSLPMKAIARWQLAEDPQRPGRKLTPKLPRIYEDDARQLKKLAAARVELKPYGSTHLRLTIFPAISA